MNEKIALGLGNNTDYEIVWDSRVIEALIIRYDIRDAELSDGREIRSERDLVVSILSFLKSGIGGERFVSSSAIVEQFSQNFEIGNYARRDVGARRYCHAQTGLYLGAASGHHQ